LNPQRNSEELGRGERREEPPGESRNGVHLEHGRSRACGGDFCHERETGGVKGGKGKGDLAVREPPGAT